MSITAQASRSQRAAGDLTLQLRTDQEIPSAQILVRPMQPGGRETVIWQGRVDKDVANNVDVRIRQHAWMPSGTQQLTVTSPQALAQTYYLFLPRRVVAGRARATDRFQPLNRLEETPRATIWHTVLQNLANRSDAYVLAPSGFPLAGQAQVAAGAPEKEVAEALGRAGYGLRTQEGVITIEPAAVPPGARLESPTPEPRPGPGRGRRWRG